MKHEMRIREENPLGRAGFRPSAGNDLRVRCICGRWEDKAGSEKDALAAFSIHLNQVKRGKA